MRRGIPKAAGEEASREPAAAALERPRCPPLPRPPPPAVLLALDVAVFSSTGVEEASWSASSARLRKPWRAVTALRWLVKAARSDLAGGDRAVPRDTPREAVSEVDAAWLGVLRMPGERLLT